MADRPLFWQHPVPPACRWRRHQPYVASLFQVSTSVACKRIKVWIQGTKPLFRPGGAPSGAVPRSGRPCPVGGENKRLLRPAGCLHQGHRRSRPAAAAALTVLGKLLTARGRIMWAFIACSCSRCACSRDTGEHTKWGRGGRGRGEGLGPGVRGCHRREARSPARSSAQASAAREGELFLPDLPKSLMGLVKHF